MHRPLLKFVVVLALCAIAGSAGAKDNAKTVVAPQDGIQWTDAGIPGVSTAVVEGNLAKGPSHFYLRYAAGFVAPVHHHSPNHFVTTVTGNLVIISDGKEYKLAPGSFFSFTGKAKHAARCEGSEDCVMFVDARGPWDVVPDKTAAKP